MSIQEVHESIQDEIALKAVRKSTLKSIKQKKRSRIKQLKTDYENQIREINIQYAEDPERLKAKYAAADYAKNERARKRAERRIKNEKALIEMDKSMRRLTIGEEVASSIVQGIGAALFVAATAILLTLGIQDGMDFKSLTIVSHSLFGASMILMYLFSCLQHALVNINAKTVFNRLSHVFTFLVIGFAYTVYSITKIGGTIGWVLFGIVWGLNLMGILFYAIAGKKHAKITTALYFVAGFSGLLLIKYLYAALSGTSFSMLMGAAGVYIVGLILYQVKNVKYVHFVSNLLFLAGSIFMFFSLFFIA
ncbi:MAG: hypothetical protein MJ188_04815 [Treponema sp.]|nr:hypothetical protein [Treponema sp.]